MPRVDPNAKGPQMPNGGVILPPELSHPSFGIIDPDYARIFTQARIIGWQYGWACVMHGSFTRDLDLLMVPWEDRALGNEEQMLKLIAQACDLRFRDGQEDIYKSKADFTAKPHGRKACSLYFKGFGDRRWIDFSFMPCADKSAPVAWLHTVAQHGGEGEQDKALSFMPDNFPLQGEESGMFYSIGQPQPLFLRAHDAGVTASSGETLSPKDADGQPLEPSETKDAAFPNRCGYCAQDMVPGSDCTSSELANKCAMYREFVATRKIEPAAMERTTQKDEDGAALRASSTAKETK